MAAAFALLACASPAAAQLPGSGLELEVLEFEGNEAFPDDSLRLAIVNRASSCRWYFCWLPFGILDAREFLRPRDLPSDVARLRIYYYERGFREAEVDTTVVRDAEENQAVLTFRIQEGQPILIDSLAFFGGDDASSDGALLENLPDARGAPLSAYLLDQVRDTLLVRLRNEGYVHADVLRSHFIPTDNPYTALVTYDIDPGPQAYVGALDLRVIGEADLSEQVVRRMLPFQEGSLYREADILQAQRNLTGLEIVRNALIALDTAAMRTSPDTLVPLRIDVVTNSLHNVRLGGGWSMSDCMNGEARWAIRNVFGGAQRFEMAARLSNILAENLHGGACPYAGVDEFGGLNWTISTELNFPWILSPRNALSASLFLERQSLPDVFIRKSLGLNLTLTRSIGLRSPLVLFYRPQRSSLEAAGIFFCVSLLVCNPGDIDILADPNWLSPVGIGVSRDRTDNLLNPSNGWAARMEWEYATRFTGSDFSYSRVTADGTWYREVSPGRVLAGRLRGGWVGAAEFAGVGSTGIQIIHPQKRFFAGGASSVRGFGQNRLGPNILVIGPDQLLGPAVVLNGDTVPDGQCLAQEILDSTCDTDALEDDLFTPRPTGGTRLFEASVEYRFQVAETFQGVTFMDFGQVWNEAGRITLSELDWTPGLGVRFFSPIGPLRLDVAYRLRAGEDLRVVTSRVRAFVPGQDVSCPGPSTPDCPDDRIGLVVLDDQRNPSGQILRIPWVQQEDLALLAPTKRLGGDRFWSRLQIHFSIGQAF